MKRLKVIDNKVYIYNGVKRLAQVDTLETMEQFLKGLILKGKR